MQNLYKNGLTSVILRVKIGNSTSTSGGGLTGLTNASSGLVISTIADNEAVPTVYTVAGSTIQTIITLGTYAAPSENNCRFKEVSSANNPGLYEIQLADARYGVSGARSLVVTLLGAANMVQTDTVIQIDAGTNNALPTVDASNNIHGLQTSPGTITSGTFQSGSTSTTGVLASGASSTDGAYVGQTITTSLGDVRTITGYVGSTRTVTVDSAWVLGIPVGGTTTYTVNAQRPAVQRNITAIPS